MQYYEPPLAYNVGEPYVKEGEIEESGTPVTLDVNATLGGNAHSGSVVNLSTKWDLYVELSQDGVVFADQATLLPQKAVDLDKEDVHSIRIDAQRNHVKYQVVAH
jgi:hypothetical protein